MKVSQDPKFKEIVLDHYKHPRFFQIPEQILGHQEEHNRTCGDHIHLYCARSQSNSAKLSFSFQGAGCSLCIASASALCALLQEVDLASCQKTLEKFQAILTSETIHESDELWKIFEGLRDYPVRSRCVRLPWQALENLLKQLAKEGD